MVETHSDHLVRRLRGLISRASAGSEAEIWLKDNVAILEVEQDEAGRSTVIPSRLNPDGNLADHWPQDFMDESADEESAIFYASIEKGEAAKVGRARHDVGLEPEVQPLETET